MDFVQCLAIPQKKLIYFLKKSTLSVLDILNALSLYPLLYACLDYAKQKNPKLYVMSNDLNIIM